MQKKHFICLGLFLIIVSSMKAQSNNWFSITDFNTNITFSMPQNTIELDTLSTRMYAAEEDSLSAVHVHIFENAQISASSAALFEEALYLENNDTLRAIGRIFILATESELTSISEVYTDGVRGIELGIQYQIGQNEEPYYSFIRYYFVNGTFAAFTHTVSESAILLRSNDTNMLFNSISFQ